ncbi:A/G-specific adenine glycosylase [Aerococcus urinaehominis]|uniref:Adenine DNA glycosylase n=1 Tax=Aerococcus urinaehominis TaxID=128944 RepID=A0A0X8FLM3_9LACT|nr:A/G-specific adenine glycosylase [Aerococcus urinaehominis]AMB99569.1 A/G-specific adenine glycosylase [Aerococcus urinaehominis]SDM35483.1 A/G-specific DNA-adenine glycosylase [Aerococcus urinaehominis]
MKEINNQAEDLTVWLNTSAIVDLGPIIAGVQVFGPETRQAFQRDLLAWYDQEKRDLPWRENQDPYRVWVSEIMLQQTQVDTVINYFNNFMKVFPTIADLAQATEADLLKVWQGLGYYSRVRNMQAAARDIMANHEGVFPTEIKAIKALKGIGPYTAGAIASIAFNQAVPAIDGNAMRVLARLFAIDADIAVAKNRKIFEEIGSYLIDYNRPGDFNQAIMDLGSSYCSYKNPQPELSPIRAYNLSTLNGTTLAYPVKSKQKKARDVYYQALLIENQQGQILMIKRSDGQLLKNMWSVPLLESRRDQVTDYQYVVAETSANYQVSPIVMKEPLAEIKHIFTHLKWHIRPFYMRLRPEEEALLAKQLDKAYGNSWCWLAASDMDQLPVARVQEKIWQVYRDFKKQ